MKLILALENKKMGSGLSNSPLGLLTILLRNPFIRNPSKTQTIGGLSKSFIEFLISILKMVKIAGKSLLIKTKKF